MEGKTLFLKFNTGPSGHGMPPAAGEALALKLAGCEDVRVFAVEGEGGLTPGASHETRNAAWGLGLSNLVFLVDWNDFGIDEFRASSVVPGTPETWFAAYDWRVSGTPDGMEWAPVTRAVLEAARGENPDKRPLGGLVPDPQGPRLRQVRRQEPRHAPSDERPGVLGRAPRVHGEVRRRLRGRRRAGPGGRRRARPPGRGQPGHRERRPARAARCRRGGLGPPPRAGRPGARARAHVQPGRRGARLVEDRRLYDYRAYPPQIWKQPGEKAPNRAALGAWGAWVNSFAKAEYGRPLFIAASADLAESTNLAGFGKGFGDLEGWGWYERDTNPRGALLPTEITEFTNAGMMAGLATVNLADDPMAAFNGFWGACSTYGSFSYLKYGPMRLFSQLAQDTELKVGKVLWVAGHSGPETAEDSRTHFGIFETGVTQLFPEGHVIDLHPWEYNEVPVVLGAALAQAAPIVALHLTRPPIELPDRDALGMPSHFEAARGAYVLRDFRPGQPAMGTVFVQGTTSTANLVKLLPDLDREGLNVKVVAAISPQLFRLQPADYRARTVTPADRIDGMAITNRAARLMHDWADGPLALEYSMGSDWDDRWRTGGTLDEVMDEAHLTPPYLLAGIERFVRERESRLRRVREALEAAESRGAG